MQVSQIEDIIEWEVDGKEEDDDEDDDLNHGDGAGDDKDEDEDDKNKSNAQGHDMTDEEIQSLVDQLMALILAILMNR